MDKDDGAVQPRKVTLAPDLDDDDEAAAVAAAERLPALVEQWEKLVVDGGHERQPDHLGLVRKHLGPMPPPERPTDLALWVGAYVNHCVEVKYRGASRPNHDLHAIDATRTRRTG